MITKKDIKEIRKAFEDWISEIQLTYNLADYEVLEILYLKEIE